MTITIGTAEKGGTFHTQGEAMAVILNRIDPSIDARVAVTPTASVGNATRLDDGEIDFGFMASNWIGRARDGTAPFDRPIALAMAAPMNTGPMFFVTLDGSSIASIPDLAGRRVAVGARESGMTQHVHTILDAIGMGFGVIEPVYLSFADGADALVAGAIDAQFQCPIPNAVMTDLSQRADVRVVPYAAGQIGRLLDAVPFYRRAVMEAGAFRGLDADSEQIGVLNVLVTHERCAGETVRAVVAGILANADDLAGANPLFHGLAGLFEPLRAGGAGALEMGGVALHPGALRAYRDAGYIG